MDSNLVCYLNDPTYTTAIQYGLLAAVTGLACARVAGVGKKPDHSQELAVSSS